MADFSGDPWDVEKDQGNPGKKVSARILGILAI